MSAYINIKKKKKTQIDYWKKEKDSRNQSTVAPIVHAQCKNTGCTVFLHCPRIGALIIKTFIFSCDCL